MKHLCECQNVLVKFSSIFSKVVFQKCELISKDNFSAISVTSPGERFSCLAKTSSKSNTLDIMKASIDFMDGLYETLIGLPLWRLYQTQGYQKLDSSHKVIHR